MRFSDEELMVMFAAGTAEALTMLYERYRHRIYRFAIGCLGSPADAEDTVQDVFLRVASCRGSLQTIGSFQSLVVSDLGQPDSRYRAPADIVE